MSRPNNSSQQLMKRFKRSMQRLAPAYTLVDGTLANGNPAVTIKSGATVIAYCAVDTMSFSGFNIVGDLSSAVGEGTPEHVFKAYFDTDASGMNRDVEALFVALAARLGCAVTEVYENTSAAAEAALIAANLKQSIPASDETGAVGA